MRHPIISVPGKGVSNHSNSFCFVSSMYCIVLQSTSFVVHIIKILDGSKHVISFIYLYISAKCNSKVFSGKGIFLLIKFKEIAYLRDIHYTDLMLVMMLLESLSCCKFGRYIPKLPRLISRESTFISKVVTSLKSSVPVKALCKHKRIRL